MIKPAKSKSVRGSNALGNQPAGRQVSALEVQQHFPFLPATDSQRLAASAQWIVLPARTTFIQQGFSSPSVFMICSGRAEVFKRNGSKVLIFREFIGGSVLGEIAAALGIPSSVSARTVEETSVISVEKNTFLLVLFSSPPLMKFLLMDCYQELLHADKQRVALCSDSVSVRLFHALLELPSLPGTPPAERTKRLPSHAALARAIGTSREVVTRSLKSLSQRGLIKLARGTVKVEEPFL